jgi:hypothetical protein
LAIVELLIGAWQFNASFDPRAVLTNNMQQFTAATPPDTRIYNLSANPNSGIVTGVSEIWGYDPMVTLRYSELLTAAAGGDPKDATMYLTLKQPVPVFALLRCAYAVVSKDGQTHIVPLQSMVGAPLPHGLIVHQVALRPSRSEALDTLLAPGFNGFNQVVLESQPTIAPEPAAQPDQVIVKNIDSDTMDIVADVNSAGILLVTDTYSKFRHATAENDSSQKIYTVMPANWAQIGIPVAKGHHHIRLNYMPTAYPIGACVSAVSVLLYLAFTLFLVTGKRPPEEHML